VRSGTNESALSPLGAAVTGESLPKVFGGNYSAVLFDLDGVLTSTAALHRAAWTSVFDDFLRRHADQHDGPFVAFASDDYERFVDGRPRFEGVRTFLDSRQIELPAGEVDDEPSFESITALGNRKQQVFLELLESKGADPLPGAVDVVNAARSHGMRTAVVSSSANAARVISAAGLDGKFDLVVDGLMARRLGLAGKPAPDTFLEAVRRLNMAPKDAIVVEDALAGVAAGASGGFGLVIGVGPPDASPRLLSHGADAVVAELTELAPD
jgi:beta-phosphoglucomutase family hydrolase